MIISGQPIPSINMNITCFARDILTRAIIELKYGIWKIVLCVDAIAAQHFQCLVVYSLFPISHTLRPGSWFHEYIHHTMEWRLLCCQVWKYYWNKNLDGDFYTGVSIFRVLPLSIWKILQQKIGMFLYLRWFDYDQTPCMFEQILSEKNARETNTPGD